MKKFNSCAFIGSANNNVDVAAKAAVRRYLFMSFLPESILVLCPIQGCLNKPVLISDFNLSTRLIGMSGKVKHHLFQNFIARAKKINRNVAWQIFMRLAVFFTLGSKQPCAAHIKEISYAEFFKVCKLTIQNCGDKCAKKYAKFSKTLA